MLTRYGHFNYNCGFYIFTKISIPDRDFDLWFRVLISSFDFEFRFRVSIFSFDFEFRFLVSITSYNFAFRFLVSISSSTFDQNFFFYQKCFFYDNVRYYRKIPNVAKKTLPVCEKSCKKNKFCKNYLGMRGETAIIELSQNMNFAASYFLATIFIRVLTF